MMRIQDAIGIGGDAILLCDGYIEPICDSDFYYTCAECNYNLHKACTKLPSTIQNPKHPHPPLELFRPHSSVNCGKCEACQQKCTGFSYSCETCEIELCIKCASLSLASIITHEARKAHKHLLTQFENSDPDAIILCNACGFQRNNFLFSCKDCFFNLDYECAMFRPASWQKLDDHQLVLVYPPYYDHREEFNYCWICERAVIPHCWMYYCAKCDYSYHPWCLLEFRKSRNLRFGQTIRVDTHCHPFSHVAEAKYKSFFAECQRRLDGEIAFCQN